MAQERLITQIDYARAGKITPQMEAVAAKGIKRPKRFVQVLRRAALPFPPTYTMPL